MKYLADVAKFHKKFNVPQPRTPGFPDTDMIDFRLKFLREELEEIEDAVMTNQLEGVLDGLVDLVYVALGTALIFGFDFDEAWDRVQQANMAKIAGVATDRHGQFDVSKPEGWEPPYLKPLVQPEHRRLNP